MTSKSAGQIAYEARFPHAGGRGEKPWKEQSRDVHELWDRVAEAVRLKVTEPVPGWRESDAEDPHGTRYACPQANIAGGHLTHDQVAFAVAMADRTDLGLEGVLNVAKDRIRWLARRLHTTEQQLSSAARDAEGMRKELGLRDSRIKALEADRMMPRFGLPPGSLQAYSDAYKAVRKGPNHLDAHIAGLRGAIVHAAELIISETSGTTAPQEVVHSLPADGPQHFLVEAKRICETDRVLGVFAAPEWDCLSEDAQMWVAAIVQQTTADLSVETVAILRRAAPFVDYACGEGCCPLWDGRYADPYTVHDDMAKMLGVEALENLQENPDAPAPATPYAVIGETYDGVKILAPINGPDHFTTEEIQEAIRGAIAKVRGPRSGDMADVVDAMNEARAEVL